MYISTYENNKWQVCTNYDVMCKGQRFSTTLLLSYRSKDAEVHIHYKLL